MIATACDLRDAIARGTTSAEEVMLIHLDRVHRHNPRLNAICTLNQDAVLDARANDTSRRNGRSPGALEGLPIGVKDVTETAGLRTTYGSSLFADHVPRHDALVVQRLRAAGAVVLGKTNTPEFAAGGNTVNPVFGATVNPWDTQRTVGGSTGGGAAALASGMIALAEGTDFGGSLRIPASFCGLVGLRPTPGLVPSHPVAQPWDFGRVNGPLARTATDVALMLGAIAGPDPHAPISTPIPWKHPPAQLRERVAAFQPDARRIGWVLDLSGLGLDADVGAVLEAAREELTRQGLDIRTCTLSLADGHEAYRTLRGQWMVNNYHALLDRIEALGPALRGNIERGLTATPEAIGQAIATQRQIWLRMMGTLEEFDIIATATVPIAPFPVTQSHPDTMNGRALSTYIDWLAQTYLITLCGIPAVSVPVGLDRQGLPVGLQLIGPRFSEPALLGLAAWIQARLGILEPEGI